jgi:hypothetical protein
MKTIEKWRWRLLSETIPGKRIKSPIPLTEAEALSRDPAAERIPGSMVLVTVYEPGDEVPANTRPSVPPRGDPSGS